MTTLLLSPYKPTRKERKQINTYLDLVKQRKQFADVIFSFALAYSLTWAQSSLQTPAIWMRDIVRTYR